MNNSFFNDEVGLQPSDRYCIAALILLCLAMFFLSVVAFLISPASILGILAVVIGILLMFGCIICFVLYSRTQGKEEQQRQKTDKK